MSDELVKQWGEYVESMGSVMGDVEHIAQQLVATNEQLTAERDKWKAAFDEACDAWQKQCEHEMNKTKAAEAERDRLREALEETAQILSQCTFETIRVHGQYIDRREAVSRALAALEGETP